MAEYATPEKQNFTTVQNCEHISLFNIKKPLGLSFCKKCGYGFYRNTVIVKHAKNSDVFITEIPNNYIDERTQTSSYIGGSQVKEKCIRQKMIKQMMARCDEMKQNQECRYFSAFIQDHFLSAKATRNSKFADKFDLYSAAALLIGTKMREVDLKTSYASEIKKFKENYWTCKELKQAEIEVAKYFDWNLHYLTYYDYLEHYLNIGILFNSDSIKKSNQQTKAVFSNESTKLNKNLLSKFNYNTPDDKIKGKPTTSSAVFDLIEPVVSAKRVHNNLTDKKQQRHSTDKNSDVDIPNNFDFNNFWITKKQAMLQNASIQLENSSSNLKVVSSDTATYVSVDSDMKDEVLLESLSQNSQRMLAKLMFDKCMEIAFKVLEETSQATFGQANMALAIVKYVRRDYGLVNHNEQMNDIWEDLYKLKDIDFTKEYKLLKVMLNEIIEKPAVSDSVNELFSFNSRVSLLNKITNIEGIKGNLSAYQNSKRTVLPDAETIKSKKSLILLNAKREMIVSPKISTNINVVQEKKVKEHEFKFENSRVFKANHIKDISQDYKSTTKEPCHFTRANTVISNLNNIIQQANEYKKIDTNPKNLLLNPDKKFINSFASIRSYSLAKKPTKSDIFKKNTNRKLEINSSKKNMLLNVKNKTPSFASNTNINSYCQALNTFTNRQIMNNFTSPFVNFDTKLNLESSRKIQPYIETRASDKIDFTRHIRKSCLHNTSVITENNNRHDNIRNLSCSRMSSGIDDCKTDKFLMNTATNANVIYNNREQRLSRNSNAGCGIEKTNFYNMKMNCGFIEKITEKKQTNYKPSFNDRFNEKDSNCNYDRKHKFYN